MEHSADTYRIENYGKRSPFASFLPAIAGIKGTPLWCYYVNRGQGVVSFGVENKDHSIMEFYPAHQAYQNVKTTGFRTFVKIDGKVSEPFADERIYHVMEIAKNGFFVEEKNEETGLSVKAEYFVLPEERAAALVREVTVENCGTKEAELEILDGMPAVIPYGVDMDNLKNMGQTAKAWMQAEDVETKVPYYRVRASIEDTASVTEIAGGNFGLGCLDDGTLLPVLADPGIVFAYDNSLRRAAGFEENGLDALYRKKQNVANAMPCCFFGVKRRLAPGERVTLHELYGQTESKDVLRQFINKSGGKMEHGTDDSAKNDTSVTRFNQKYFQEKKETATALTEELCTAMKTVTASREFDEYCQYTYMDNLLRGGYPIKLGNDKVFYVYSRKHGDLERDYNYFSIRPERYSQGNGNFRDVNQNRRCDAFFAPFVGRKNVTDFYSLIQLDGYNPLAVEMMTYRLSGEDAGSILCKEGQEELRDFVMKSFTPGEMYGRLESLYEESEAESLFGQLIDAAQSMVNASFGEGYWSDHWTYNLDLIEDYLEIYPDEEESLFFEESCTCFRSQIKINPREARYAETQKGLRQYHALDEESLREDREVFDKLVRCDFQKGEILKLSVMEKLLLLCATKFAALDAYGMGVEMEGGKPGWYDALNGLPGMFGSSMAETYELARMLAYTVRVLKKYQGEVRLLKETGDLLDALYRINMDEQAHITALKGETETEKIVRKGEVLSFWNRINDVKEDYRDKVFAGVKGNKRVFAAEYLVDALESFLLTVNCGIEKAIALGKGLCPTYFYYSVPEYERTEKGFHPLKFVVEPVPFFLEGPVRYLKLDMEKADKEKLYQTVKKSALYDGKLHMYKVNAALGSASYELGRARAFTPGWLENESIWLHMEYKYLLELLRSGLYEAFFEDFKNAAVPFLDPEVYGRSIYENSSFIASSSNPDESLHGKGFVARLSGSTIEFISMWKLLFFGKSIFRQEEGELAFCPQPAMPAYLIPEDGKVSAVMLGDVAVTYRFGSVRDYVPGTYEIKRMEFIKKSGQTETVEGGMAKGKLAEEIRGGLVERIEIEISTLKK